MNPKQISCLLLFVLTAGFGYLIAIAKEKRQTAVDEMKAAEVKRDDAVSTRANAQKNLDTMKRDTAASRQFLVEWKPQFEKADTEIKARLQFIQLLSETEANYKGKFLIVDKGGAAQATPNRDMSYVNRRVSVTAKVMGDFQVIKNFIAKVEQQLPTCRISALNITKAQRQADVEATMTVDLPLTSIAKATP